MIKGTKEQVVAELYRRYPARFRSHGESPEYFFAAQYGSFEEQLKDLKGPGKVIFFHLLPKNSALSLEQEDIEIIL